MAESRLLMSSIYSSLLQHSEDVMRPVASVHHAGNLKPCSNLSDSESANANAIYCTCTGFVSMPASQKPCNQEVLQDMLSSEVGSNSWQLRIYSGADIQEHLREVLVSDYRCINRASSSSGGTGRTPLELAEGLD